MKFFKLTVLLIAFSNLVFGQSDNPIIFIYDASGSMWGEMENGTKHQFAKETLLTLVQGFDEKQSVGLFAYGHRQKGDCDDVEELIDYNAYDLEKLKTVMKTLQPKGKTPLARSAELVVNKLSSLNQKATIILITDGIESCDGRLCDYMKKCMDEGIEIKLHIVGFGILNEDISELQCAAEATNGKYLDAQNAGELLEGLEKLSQEKIDTPPVNANFSSLRNDQPIDAMFTFYNPVSNDRYVAIRTYGSVKDVFLPVGKYKLLIQPLENSDLKELDAGLIEIVENGDNRFEYSFDSGKVGIETLNNDVAWDALVYIFKSNTSEKVASGRTYGALKEFELAPGSYDIELKPMKIEGASNSHKMNGVVVKGRETNSLKYSFKSASLNVGVQKNGELIDAVIHINLASDNAYVAGGRSYKSPDSNPKSFLLEPGTYKIVVKPTDKSIGAEKSIEVTLNNADNLTKVIDYN